ncbi:MAG: hypothetical protein ACK46X_13055 [Candidatus Sericytochromatia bacterium]
MTKRVWAMVVAGLMLAGCGQALPGTGARAMAEGFSAAAAKRTVAKNPFLGLTVTVEPLALLCECVSISATNGAKLKVAVSYEDGGIEGVSVNRTVLVKGGKLMLTKEQAEPLEWLLDEDSEAAATPEERRKKSYMKILEQLAEGLKAGKTKKDQAKDVETIVDALKAFVKAQRQAESPGFLG